MPAPNSVKLVRSSKQRTQNQAKSSGQKRGKSDVVGTKNKPSKSYLTDKTAQSIKLGKEDQQETVKSQDWDIDSLFATVKEIKKDHNTSSKVNLVLTDTLD